MVIIFFIGLFLTYSNLKFEKWFVENKRAKFKARLVFTGVGMMIISFWVVIIVAIKSVIQAILIFL